MNLNDLFNEHSNMTSASKDIEVSFCNNENMVISELKKYSAAVGAAPWLTNYKILDSLFNLEQGSCFIVDKQEMEERLTCEKKPKYKSVLNDKTNGEILTEKFNSITPLEFYFRNTYESAEDIECGSTINSQHIKNKCRLRFIGFKKTLERKVVPLLHHKIMILGSLDYNDFNFLEFKPEVVITGSFNFTYGATLNRETIIKISDESIVDAFYLEWLRLYKLSESDFNNDEMKPELLNHEGFEGIKKYLDEDAEFGRIMKCIENDEDWGPP